MKNENVKNIGQAKNNSFEEIFEALTADSDMKINLLAGLFLSFFIKQSPEESEYTSTSSCTEWHNTFVSI